MSEKGNPKRLIIAPHADDEVLWCYSVLEGSDVVVLGARNGNGLISDRISKEIGYNLHRFEFQDRFFYKHFNEIRIAIEDVIIRVEPDEIYYPSTTHHQDHNTINEISKVIARPMRMPSLKLLAEYPYWGLDEFRHNMIREVDEKKFCYVDMYKEKQWSRYIRGYNNHISNKYDYGSKRFYETFNIIFSNV